MGPGGSAPQMQHRKYLRGRQGSVAAAYTVCSRTNADYHDGVTKGCVPGIPPHRMLAIRSLTHACNISHNRGGGHCRKHTCREEHRVECCSTLDGKYICILAAFQGGARLLKWPAGCPNLRSGFVSRDLMLLGVQKRFFAHNSHSSVHAATRAGQ